MIAPGAWASFLSVQTDKSDIYRIRFNLLASKLFDGATYVSIRKTPTHIVLKPLPMNAAGYGTAFPFSRESSGAVNVSANWLVKHDGFLRRDMFNGSRYKVKRDGKGLVYICLKERM